MSDPVFKTVEYAFSKARPDAVVLEGIDPAVPMDQFVKHAYDCAAGHFATPGTQCDEPAFAGYLAAKNGAAIYTGEPPAARCLRFSNNAGMRFKIFLHFRS